MQHKVYNLTQLFHLIWSAYISAAGYYIKFRCIKIFVMFSEFFLKQFSKADMYLDHIKLYSFFSTSHNLWVWRQNLLVQAVLAWAVGWKSMAACSEIMQCRKKLKSLKCAEYIPASENHFKKKFWRHEIFLGYLIKLLLYV